jgi:hypothetical protein
MRRVSAAAPAAIAPRKAAASITRIGLIDTLLLP